MATITLKNVPKQLHVALKQRAKRHKRSLNQEALHCLDASLGRGQRDPVKLLQEIRELRARTSIKQVSPEWIDEAIRTGRP